MSDLFPYSFGPKGRHIVVDSNGRIVSTNEQDTTLYVFGYGDTGRPMAVDASGRLIISPLSINAPLSGWNLPAGRYGDYFFHLASGFMRYGTSWQQQETPWPHHASFWIDTTPDAGEETVLSTAGTYYRLVSQVAASGGMSEGHGLVVSASGITITDIESRGDYYVSYSCSFNKNGAANVHIFGAVFKNEDRVRGTQFQRTLSTALQAGNVGGQDIIELEDGDELSFRFMSTTAGVTLNVITFNFTIYRVSKH